MLGSGEPAAAPGDLYASVLNQDVTSWRLAPAAVTVERTVVRWLAEAAGCPGFTGHLVSDGSLGNGHWPLIRYNPVVRVVGRNPFFLDSPRPAMKLVGYQNSELRFRALAGADPAGAEPLLALAQHTVGLCWQTYGTWRHAAPWDFPAAARKDG